MPVETRAQTSTNPKDWAKAQNGMRPNLLEWAKAPFQFIQNDQKNGFSCLGFISTEGPVPVYRLEISFITD